MTTEHMPGLASETIGIWVAAGSRDESIETAGSTHFLEHMLFKGTPTKDAKTIAAAFDRTGGDSNAITAKELTCYYSRCLVTDLSDITALLVDMVSNSKLDAEEFERERGVIIEELAMSADDPGEVLFDDFDKLIFGDHPLARPVGATKDQIRVLGHHTLLEHHFTTYVPPRLVIAAAGGATHDEVLVMVEDALSQAGIGSEARTHAWDESDAAGSSHGRAARVAPTFHSGRSHTVKDTEQLGILLGCEGLEEGHPDRFVYSVLLTMLGGGMSSRLFQSVREQRGLAYAVNCVASQFTDFGTFGIYAGCTPENGQAVVDLALAEWDRLAQEAPSRTELDAIVSQLSGSMVLGLESSAARMNRLARSELFGIPLESPLNLIERVRSVTAEQVSTMASDLMSRPKSLSLVGPQADVALP
ncbi:MAG: insulinase family protein [Brevibacterium sp.]|uniref:M16 family metallopeptidase n=1 Tax=Brevibacterium sp. TaxID=1701 RepID=UPI0026483F3D|nr:pitrilysin family protein [Brevibacterium sp.]MDN5807646.1 insulinase family protein [Brevibacterium sp.]MDN5833429.1 insulinase family protein [Brevibacterium sp.]MDN5909056.1 insulinase family protein [Brevibacterium sp.]MDN6124001.1 insulinase family protein [Brevibacterium sp.]MDN6133928.1 insulinase family protein [Brevibacterium sp.]